MSGLERFGQSVARSMGGQVPPGTRARTRARVVAAPAERNAGAFGAWAAAVVVVVLAVGSLTFWSRASEQLEVTGATGRLVEGDWLTAPREARFDIEFEDRGRIGLAQGARARLSKVSRERVEVALEAGTVQVDVRPKSGTTWLIAAGPYRVEVLGTAFTVQWRAEKQDLEVRVQRGVVRVMGASLAQHGVELQSGDSLLANAGTGQALLSRESRTAAESAAGKAELVEQSEAAPKEPISSNAAPTASAPEGEARTAEDFRELARNAKYSDALALAEELGFESLTNSLNATDLALLANAARYQKQPGKARLALLALRRRFPRSSEAGTATFLLGRLAAEQGQDYSAAAKWFLTYSQEYPKGPMAAEALGRRVQVLAISGQNQVARDAAEQYLKLYPGGAYAAVAQGVLDGRKLKSGP